MSPHETHLDTQPRAEPDFETRRINRQLRSHLLDFMFFGALFIASMWITINRSVYAIPLWLGVGCIIGVWAIAFTRQQRRFCRMKCPNCMRPLSHKRTAEEEPILFRCEDCRIIWDTGFSHSSDPGG